MPRPTSLLLAVMLLACAVSGQSGTYTTFGGGCAGSGAGPGCLSANWGQPLATVTGAAAANFGVLVNTGGAPRLVCGFEFFCRTQNATPTTMNVWIYDRDAATQRPGNVLRSSTMTVGITPAAYRAMVTPPLLIQPNTDFFLVLDNRVGRLYMPIMTTGNLQVHYWNGPPNWSGPHTTQRWNYNVLCCGQAGAIPALSAAGVPRLGNPFQIDLTQAKASTAAILLTGVSNTAWGPFKLPLDLTPAGAAGCNLLVSMDFLAATAVDSAGKGSLTIPFPSDVTWLGLQFHNQWAVVDAVNALQLAFSNGASGQVGR